MRGIWVMGGRGFLALICSALMVYQPVSAAWDPAVIAGASSEQTPLEKAFAAADIAAPLISYGEPNSPPESIAVAKLSGTADRNGQPLVNGSIITSGDLLSTHGDSALLLSSTPQERLWLGPNTSAKVTKDSGNLEVSLEHGTLGFQTHGHMQVTFENHDGLAVRGHADSPARGQLSFVSNQEAQVRVQEGSLELVQGGHSLLLQPANAGAISAGAVHPSGGQEATASGAGSINGTVVDSNLFVQANAKVTLTNGAGKVLTAASDHAGKFSFSNVAVGNYTLRVTQPGFKSYELKDVVVRAGNESSLYVQLGAGGAAAGNNHILLWVLIGGGAAGAIGAIAAAHGSSSSSSSPSTTQ